MSQHTPSDTQLARYLADELSAEERVHVEAWLDADPAHRAELTRLRTLSTTRRPSAAWNVDRAWSQVDAKLEEPGRVLPFATVEREARDESPAQSRPRVSRSSAWVSIGWRVAASVLLVVGAGYFWRERTAAVPGGPSDTRVATALGESRDLVLGDSTLVTLGPSSTLLVRADYGRTERSVELTGEAWFRVRHDDARPFSVRAAGTITLDIGTEFSVRALDGDSLVRVHVFEGAASLRRATASPSRAALLRTHEVGVLVANRDDVRTSIDSTGASWRTGSLTFEQAPLDDVIAELRRWYRGPFERANTPGGTRRVSATLPTSDLPEALEILRLALGITIEQAGDTVRIR